MTVATSRGMRGTLKKFDRVEHNTYDKKGRDAFRKFLNLQFEAKGYKTIDNANEHGIDLLTLNSDGEVIYCWEIEVRHGNWQGDVAFPFGAINCIERKDHQWRREKSFTSKIPNPLADEYGVYYVQLNKECTRAVIIKDKVILEHNLKPWSNRKAEGEYVRQVPLNRTTQVRIAGVA